MTKLKPEYVRLWEWGFALHWLKSKTKEPVEKRWTTGPRLTLEQLEERYRPGQNIGVRLGTPSAVGGGYLAVIDLDIKSADPKHRAEAMAWLEANVSQALTGPYLVSGRGNGSAHFYVRLKQPVAKNKFGFKSPDLVPVDTAKGLKTLAAWETSLLCDGRQSVLVGSTHPDTGRKYQWGKTPLGAEDFPWFDVTGIKSEPMKRLPKQHYEFINVDPESLDLRSDQVAAIVNGTGVTDASDSVYRLCAALLRRRVAELPILSLFTDRRFYLGETGFKHAKTEDRQTAANWVDKYCLIPARADYNKTVFDLEPGEPLPNWHTKLEIGGKPPRIKLTQWNLCLILGESCGTPNYITRDLFTNSDRFTVDTPWGNKTGQNRSGNEDDELRIKKWLSQRFKIEPNTSLIREVLGVTAVENPSHPLRDYLNARDWDGEERIDTAFKRYLGADMPEPYLSDVTRKFFLACVKRAYEPGCKFDHVPILEGLQGKGKSTFIRNLAGSKWFMDSLPSMADKDAAVYIQGIWICELGELATLSKGALAQVKAFITREDDKFRPPYGRTRVDHPRTTVFVGTTDQCEYLNDPEGNRRYWPVRVTQCDFKALSRDRNQLWAEAVFKYHFEPEPLWLTGDSARQAIAIHAERRVEDENDALLVLWDNWVKENGSPSDTLRVSELIKPGMPFFGFPQTPGYTNAAARVLRLKKYLKKHTETGNVWVLDTPHSG